MQEGKVEHDERVRRTRAAIVESFNALFLSRRYDDIQVSEIIHGAHVGRSTFYEHFRNKDELLRHSMGWLMGALADALTEGPYVRQRILGVLAHIRESVRVARPFLNGPSSDQATRALAFFMSERLEAVCADRSCGLAIPIRLAAAQLAESQLGLIRAWLDAPSPGDVGGLTDALIRSTRATAGSLLTPASGSPGGAVAAAPKDTPSIAHR